MDTEQPQYRSIECAELETLFRQASSGDSDDGEAFLGSFEYVRDLSQGNYSAALDRGLDLLKKCKNIDLEAYEKTHKGTPVLLAGYRRVYGSRLSDRNLLL